MSTPVGDRGLRDYADELDYNGEPFRVRSSSLATEPCVWIQTEQVIGRHMGQDLKACLYLTVENAHAVRAALAEWLEDVGEPLWDDKEGV